MRKRIAQVIMFGILLGVFHKIVKPVVKTGAKGTVKVVKFIV